MSKAGGIAYLLKHGRAPFPVTTRTQQPRAKGVKRMAEGGLPNANAPLNYGTVPDYVFVPGSMEIDQNTGKPVWKSGRYELRSPSAAGAGAGAGATSNVGVPRIGTSSDGGRSTAEPSAWDGMSDAEKAAYYAENPTMSKITEMGQQLFGLTSLGALQAKLAPDFVSRQQQIALGINPDTGMPGNYGTQAYGPMGGGGYGISIGGDDPTAGEAEAQANLSSPAVQAGIANEAPTITSEMRAAAEREGGIGNDAGPSMDSGWGGYSGSDRGGWFANGGIVALAGGGQPQGPRLLSGGGDGLSDGIPAVIGKGQPARLADGEFVVSADVVSALGGGSTKAGAKKLYAMMDRIRQNAHGTKKQVKKVNERKVLPA